MSLSVWLSMRCSPLAGTPDLNAMFDEPLDHIRRFTLDTAKPVEHKDQQDIKAAFLGLGFQLLDGIALAGGYF